MLDSPRGLSTPAATPAPAADAPHPSVMDRPAPKGVDNLLWKLSGPQERYALLKDAPPVPEFKGAGGGSVGKTWDQNGSSHGASKSIGRDGDFKDVKTSTTTSRAGTTTTSQGTVTDIRGKSAPVDETEVKGAKPKVTAEAKVGTDWEGNFGANYKTGGINSSGAWSAEAFAGAKVKADASASVGKDGIKAQAGASAFAGVEASASGSHDLGPGSVGGSGTVRAGAGAEGEVKAGIGRKGVDLGVEGKAELSAEAEASASAEVGGVKGTVEGGVGVGIGIHGDAGVEFSAKEIGVHYDVGAFVGLGGHVSGGFEIDPSRLASNVGSWLSFG